jgi:hypothetical protein
MGVAVVFWVFIIPELLTVATVRVFVPISNVPPAVVVKVPLEERFPLAVSVPLELPIVKLVYVPAMIV